MTHALLTSPKIMIAEGQLVTATAMRTTPEEAGYKVMPIVFLASHTQTYARAKKAGPWAFLSKPYNRMDLLAQTELARISSQEN